MYKVACTGSGYFSQFHYDAWIRLENVKLVGSMSLTKEDAAKTGQEPFDDLSQMLIQTKPDILDIITPPTTHLDFIKIALEHGIQTIICQKPFCNNIKEAEEAILLAEEKGTNIIVHENFRFQPWYRKIKQVLDEHLIGDLHQITFRLRTGDGQGPSAYLERQPYFQKMPKFLIHETGVHWIDTFCFLMNETPQSVYADLRKLNQAILGEDAGYMILEFSNGKRALFDGNRHLDHEAENHRMTLGECLVEGSKGTINLHGDGSLHHRHYGSMETNVILAPQNWKGFAGDCVYALQNHVIKALEKSQQFENTAQQYLIVLKIEEAAYLSNFESRLVTV